MRPRMQHRRGRGCRGGLVIDRKSVVEGKRGDVGGGPIIKKKKKGVGLLERGRNRTNEEKANGSGAWRAPAVGRAVWGGAPVCARLRVVGERSGLVSGQYGFR